MGFWSKVGQGLKSFVGAGYSTAKKLTGIGRTVLNSIYNLKNVPGFVEIATELAANNPELALTISAGIAGAETVVSTAEKTEELIDSAVAKFSNNSS